MSNVTSINKRPYLTKQAVFDNLCEEVGSSDKLMLVALKDDGSVVVYSSNNMTPAEELFMATYMYSSAVDFSTDCANVNSFTEDQWE